MTECIRRVCKIYIYTLWYLYIDIHYGTYIYIYYISSYICEYIDLDIQANKEYVLIIDTNHSIC